MKNHGHQFKIGDRNPLKISRIFDIFGNFRLNFRKKLLISRSNKRDFRADVLSLLSSALRPRLLSNRDESCSNVAKIVTLSTILGVFGLLHGIFYNPPNVSATSITLTIPNSFSLNIIPTNGGNFAKSESSNITVKTDNDSGYTLSIKAKNSENGNSLLNGKSKLNSITEQTSENLFKSDSKFNNAWGYLPSKFNSLDNTDFLPGPNTEESILDITKEANNVTGTDYSITIGAKVDDAVLAGNYSNEFIINAVTNAPIKYLQDFTADDCAALIQDDGNNTEDMAVTLIDKRDGNEYRVGKLADGKCWMLQGLRIMDKNISSADSDMIDSDGTFKVPSSDNAKFVSSDNNNNAAYYYEDNEDDSGYYTWYTATAGTGTTEVTDTDASSSICPKGWRLPKSGPGGSDTSELVALLKAYGGSGNDGTGQQDIIDNLVKPSFPNYGYVGSINYNNGVLTDFGKIGYYWSSTAYSAGDAYGIFYNNSNTNLKPGDHGAKRRGRPVRCLADDAPKVKFTYHLNSGTMNGSSAYTARINTPLTSFIPIRANYAFVGWCDHATSSSSCSGKIYQPGEIYSGSSQADLNFYAVWESANKGSLGTMQDFDCVSLPYYHQYGTVTDSRDSNTYTVAKLNDGKCWMTQNLRIINRTINYTNSDMDSGSFTIPSSRSSGWNRTNYTNPMTYYSGNTNYGVLYTWLTATAGTGTTNITNTDAPSSICPKGWRLPTSIEARVLVKLYGYNQAQSTLANFGSNSWAGICFENTCPNSQGTFGHWWLSTAYDSANASILVSSNTEWGVSPYDYKGVGTSVRCITREDE